MFPLGSFFSSRNAVFIGFSPKWKQVYMRLSAGVSSSQELSVFLGVSGGQVPVGALAALLAGFLPGQQLEVH